MTRDQLVEALYQKGLSLAEIESANVRILAHCISQYRLMWFEASNSIVCNWIWSSYIKYCTCGSMQRGVESTTEVSKDKDGNNDQSAWEVIGSDLFEENFKELKKWVDVKSSKYGILLVTRERRSGRPGAALKVLLIQLLIRVWSHSTKWCNNHLDCCCEMSWSWNLCMCGFRHWMAWSKKTLILPRSSSINWSSLYLKSLGGITWCRMRRCGCTFGSHRACHCSRPLSISLPSFWATLDKLRLIRVPEDDSLWGVNVQTLAWFPLYSLYTGSFMLYYELLILFRIRTWCEQFSKKCLSCYSK